MHLVSVRSRAVATKVQVGGLRGRALSSKHLTDASPAVSFSRDGLDAPDEDVEAGLETGLEVVARALLPERPEDPAQRRNFPRRLRLDACQNFPADVEPPEGFDASPSANPWTKSTNESAARTIIAGGSPDSSNAS